MSKTHELKTWPPHFEEIAWGRKRAELRLNDRDFQPGDKLLLREYDPGSNTYTGSSEWVVITHVLTGPGFGLLDGYAMLSIQL